MDSIVSIGQPAPPFELRDLMVKNHSLDEYQGRVVVLNFWSAECDWCERVDKEATAYLDSWKDQVKAVWIASNANESVSLIEKIANERKLPIVLLDGDHQVADSYGAQVTPHFFIVDGEGILRYQGAWDDITFRQRTVTQVYVPMVIEALLNQQVPKVTSTPAYGCTLVRYSG
jgi:peroxiredoxin